MREGILRVESVSNMSDIVKKSKEAESALLRLKEEMYECNQDRSYFQLEKFVIGQHDRPGRRYLQLMTELHCCYIEIKKMLLAIEEEKIEIDLQRGILSRASFDCIVQRMANLKISQAELKIETIEYNLDCKLKEFSKLMAIKESLKKYSAAEIEKEEQEYYLARLERQSIECKASHATGIPVGELRAQLQAGMIRMTIIVQDGKEVLQIQKLSPQQQISNQN